MGATTSCTSSPYHGNLSLLSSHPQLWPMVTLHLSFLSPSLAPALPSSEMLLAILVALSTSKMESMPSHLLPSEPACLIPLPQRLQTSLLEMLPAPTLSTCSLVLESHGPWLPSTGSLRARASLSPSEAWDSL